VQALSWPSGSIRVPVDQVIADVGREVFDPDFNLVELFGDVIEPAFNARPKREPHFVLAMGTTVKSSGHLRP
jgi:hypothetical protein